VTFEVLPDGSLRPYVPKAIQFRDGEFLRPVAPFFELWATVQSDVTGESSDQPITLQLLDQLGISTDNIQYSITVGNRKAERRAGSASCAYLARAVARASDCKRKALLACSPRNADEQPLVSPSRPVPLGYFQAIRPVVGPVVLKTDLSVLRVRFTPARGLVYGPPNADVAPASPLQPGEEPPAVALAGKLHQVVPAENRIVNSDTPWSRYAMDQMNHRDPAPSDSYDGANVGTSRSLSVIDDSCDGVIEAQLVVDGRRVVAAARVISSCPDFAPDRRPFYSLADDIEDRDLIDDLGESIDSLKGEIANLFKRVFETASTINLDATRNKFIAENRSVVTSKSKYRRPPRIDEATMTKSDGSYADLTPSLLPDTTAEGAAPARLRYPDIARLAHSKLADFETLMEFLASHRDYVTRLVRPPFGRFSQLKGGKRSARDFRDPRVERDTLHDMRMPPFMRDSDANPLSLSWRQYQRLMRLVEHLADERKIKAPSNQAGRRRGQAKRDRQKMKSNSRRRTRKKPG